MKTRVRFLCALLLSLALITLAAGCKVEDLGLGRSAFGGQPTPTATAAAAPTTQNPTATSVSAASRATQATSKAVEAEDFVGGKVKLLPPGPSVTSQCSRDGQYTLHIVEKCKWWGVPAEAYKAVWGSWNYSQEAAFWLAIWGGIDLNTDPDNATNTSICLAPPGTDIYPYLATILEKVNANPQNYGGWAKKTQANLANSTWVSKNFPEYERVKEYLARGEKK